MTAAEIIAFNAGVRTALDHARRVAEALASVPSWKPTRVPFAVAALDEFAEAGKMLLIPVPPGAAEPAAGHPPPPPGPATGRVAASVSSRHGELADAQTKGQ